MSYVDYLSQKTIVLIDEVVVSVLKRKVSKPVQKKIDVKLKAEAVIEISPGTIGVKNKKEKTQKSSRKSARSKVDFLANSLSSFIIRYQTAN